MSPSDTSYDIIFAGGGAAACVTAGRLAAADPSLKILILEAGAGTKDVPDHVQPARYFKNLAMPSQAFTLHIAKPSEAVAGRAVICPTGRCLGGGSNVNFAMYARASASDYDDWESVYDNPGWGSRDLIPLMKKAENYQSSIPGDHSTHGASGPLKISIAEDHFGIASQFLDAAAQYDKERGLVDDTNDFFTCNGYGRWLRYIDPETGKRQDTAHHYIYNQSHNNNLKVLERSRVIRVVFENNCAVGVEYVDDTVGRSKSNTPEPLLAKASRLVVVSGGTFGSSLILERSGIGASDAPKKNKTDQAADPPGVGEGYMDHNIMFPPYFASDDADTMDVVFRGDEEQLGPYVAQWHRDGKGLMSHNGVDAGIKIRPNEQDLREIGPAFGPRWNSHFANALDKPLMWIGPLAAYAGADPTAPQRKYFSMAYSASYPISVGRLHIGSGHDAYAPPDLEPGFLDDPLDVDVLRWGYKKGRELARRMASYRGEFEAGHPGYPKGSKAAAKESAGPVDALAPDLIYSPEDNKAIDTYIRENVGTTWHGLGTCSMKPREQGGVVDFRLNVYGTKNLKIADCSIGPSNVGANTYNTAIAIGEKAAVLIAQDLGIKLED